MSGIGVRLSFAVPAVGGNKMSSGEADGVKTYDVTVVHTSTKTETNRGDWTGLSTNTTTPGVSNGSTLSVGSITWNDNYTIGTGSNYYWTYPYYQTKYMYQIRCPRCHKMNWCELDNTTSCTKCRAMLRAVSKRIDYDVPIET